MLRSVPDSTTLAIAQTCWHDWGLCDVVIANCLSEARNQLLLLECEGDVVGLGETLVKVLVVERGEDDADVGSAEFDGEVQEAVISDPGQTQRHRGLGLGHGRMCEDGRQNHVHVGRVDDDVLLAHKCYEGAIGYHRPDSIMRVHTLQHVIRLVGLHELVHLAPQRRGHSQHRKSIHRTIWRLRTELNGHGHGLVAI
jgi:hypothetical protein